MSQTVEINTRKTAKITVSWKATKVSHVHAQHAPEFDFLTPRPTHPMARHDETLGRLHRYTA